MRHTKDSIQALLMRNNEAVERAMIVIYDRQTQDEKATSDTRHTNQRGFSGAHAKMGSYYARWVLGGRRLTGRHLDKARAMSLHYWRQLIEEAERKASKNREGGSLTMASKVAKLDRGNPDFEGFPKLVLPLDPTPDEELEQAERIMQQMEAAADRAQTLREEEAKERYKAAMEDH